MRSLCSCSKKFVTSIGSVGSTHSFCIARVNFLLCPCSSFLFGLLRFAVSTTTLRTKPSFPGSIPLLSPLPICLALDLRQLVALPDRFQCSFALLTTFALVKVLVSNPFATFSKMFRSSALALSLSDGTNNPQFLAL